MIPKLTTSDSFNFGEATNSLVPVSSRGTDAAYIKKIAGEQGIFHKELSELKPEADNTYVHLIALGDEEDFGCLVAGTPVLLPDGSYRAIDSLAVGDQVLSGQGVPREVTHTFRRTVPTTVAVSVEGLADRVIMSPNHPVKRAVPGTFTCIRDKYRRCKPGLEGKCNICRRGRGCSLSERDWTDIQHEICRADQLTTDDYLVFELPYEAPPREISEAEARLIGYWLAEGSFGKHYDRKDKTKTGGWRYSTLVLSFGIHEENTFAADAVGILAELGIGAAVRTTADSCAVVTSRTCYNLVDEYLSWFGAGARAKKLPLWTMSLPRSVRENLVYGYVCGDGTVVKTPKEARVTVGSVSHQLLAGMQRLLWSLDVPAVICRVHGRTEPARRLILDQLCTVQPVLHLSYACERAPALLAFGGSRVGGSKIRTIIKDGVVYLPVREVQTAGGCEVFNLEVAVDHDYISVGFYSHNCNRNADAFSREDNIKKHATFVELGHVFKNHKSDDPEKAVGDVLASAHNGEMGRVELLVALKNKLLDKEIDALNSGKQLAFSMGSLQDYDVCSVCQHRAPTAKDHCDHVKNHLREVLDDGRMIYMKNPNPKFFDISIVHKPADRVAYMLKKVALEQHIVGGHELADAFGFSHWAHPKYAVMKALAKMMKQIPAFGRKVAAPRDLDAATVARLKTAAAGYGIDQVIEYLNKQAVMLGPKDFADVVVGHPCGCGFPEDDKLDDVMDDRTQLDAFEEPRVKEQLPELLDKADHAAAGMDPENAAVRSIQITIAKPVKTAGVFDPHELAALQYMYKQYKVAFATYHRTNPKILSLVAATF